MRGVKHAARKLPEECRESFILAFDATGAWDVYDGKLERYMTVILQTLEGREKEVNGLRKMGETICNIIRGN